MSLKDILSDDEPGNLTQSMMNITVEELIQIYGEEAVRRGLSYMDSLSEADQQFRSSGGGGSSYAQEYADAIFSDDTEVDEERMQELQEDWEEAMEGDGLGLDK